jgi:hypothetical protein
MPLIMNHRLFISMPPVMKRMLVVAITGNYIYFTEFTGNDYLCERGLIRQLSDYNSLQSHVRRMCLVDSTKPQVFAGYSGSLP